ncbi:hypothetical protein [Halovulum sp. GXIMD14793]
MTQKNDQAQKKAAQKADKQARLAEALRANLKRRKAQDRARAEKSQEAEHGQYSD